MRHCFSLILGFLFCAGAPGSPQDARRLISDDEARKWESITGAAISPDGRWAWYGLKAISGEARLVVRNTNQSQAYIVARGSEAAFSGTGEGIVYRIGSGSTTRLGFRDLRSGDEQVWEGVSTYGFVQKGKRLALFRPTQRELVVWHADMGATQVIRQVTSMVVSPTGDQVAFVREETPNLSTLAIWKSADSKVIEVASGQDKIANVTWSAAGKRLGFMAASRVGDGISAPRRIGVADLSNPRRLSVLDPRGSEGWPTGWLISEEYELFVADEADTVVFGGVPDRTEPSAGTPSVEVWSSRDTVTVPERRAMAPEAAKRERVFLWKVGSPGVNTICKGVGQTIEFAPDGRTALVTDSESNRVAATGKWADLRCELVDLKNGSRRVLLEKTASAPTFSRTGRWITAFHDGNWWLFDTRSKSRRNLTRGTKVSFADQRRQFGQDTRIPAASAQWLADDSRVLLSDAYDVWEASPEAGTLSRLTDGRSRRMSFRWEPIESENAELFHGFDERTKDTGFFARESDGKIKPLLFGDYQFRLVTKSKEADRVLFVRSSSQSSPNVFVTDRAFAQPRQISRVNEQESQFLFPKVERLDYRSRSGEALQAILVYPAGYVSGNRYPMITYVYERLSDNLNGYLMPNPDSPYNPMMLAQRGYFVLMPDIVFERRRKPGEDAKDCVEAALDVVARKGIGVDMSKVGIMGHSFGGYEAAYISTFSKRFSAAAMGSGLSDFASMAGLHYWKSGTPNTLIIETAQGRMDVPLWEDPKAYLDSSTVWNINRRTSPILIQVGDKDEIVDWSQGLQLYNAARRAGKDAVMLVYRGEGHYLERNENLRDYARRLRHFFDVHLKGVRPEAWLSEGNR